MIYDHVSGALSELDLEIVRAVPPGGNWRNLPTGIDSARVRQIRVGAARGDGSRSTYYGRLQWDRPSYTISTYFNRPGNGCFIHPAADRLITIREAARLQSFPDAYRFSGGGRSRYVQVGNAVPPLLAYQLGAMLKVGSVVDLFCGAGGLSLGLEWAGFETVAGVDHDAAAVSTFQKNRSDRDVGLCADLSDDAKFQKVMDDVKRRVDGSGVDLVAGGPPCQGFSTAGRCQLDDSRNKLLYSFVRAVDVLRPAQVLMENVAALTYRGRRPFLEEVRKAFHQLGYKTWFIVAHSEGYGVPQLRRRLFLVALRTLTPRWPAPFRKILEPMMRQYQPVPPEYGLPYPVTVREALGDLPLEVAPSSDAVVDYQMAAGSQYGRWLRGEISLDGVCPHPMGVFGPAPLFDAAGME